jgi:mono/diheme cytochrome c family protein
MNRNLKGAIICGAVFSLFVAIVIKAEFMGGAFQRSAVSRSSPPATKVDELFKQNCARCHGADGRGETPSGQQFNAPDFTDPDWWKENNTSNRSLAATVARGKDEMPAFGKKLTKSEINALVKYVRSFRKVN